MWKKRLRFGYIDVTVKNSNKMKKVVIIITLVMFALNANAQQTFNSSDPNDYTYTLTITPMGVCSYGGGKTVYINGRSFTVTGNSVHKGSSGVLAQYADKTPVYQHTFNNFTDLTDTLPILLNKLVKQHINNKDFQYRIDYSVMDESCFKLFVAYSDWNKHKSLYKKFMESDIECIKGDLMRYVADNATKLKCTYTYDIDGNMIYTDYNGNNYVWDIENSEYVPANMVQPIN